MSKTSLLNVAQRTLMVLGAAYLINCGSTVFAPADAQSQDESGYTEYRATCANVEAPLPFEADDQVWWARIAVPGSSSSRLRRAFVNTSVPGGKAFTYFKTPHYEPTTFGIPYVAQGYDFDETIWVWCGYEGSETVNLEYVALVPDF